MKPATQALLDAMRPLALDGNQYASLYCLRIQFATDPDREAEKITAEFGAICESMQQVITNMLDAFGLAS